jgi:hypothetical protein
MHREMVRDQKRKEGKRNRLPEQLLIHSDDLKRFAVQLWTK